MSARLRLSPKDLSWVLGGSGKLRILSYSHGRCAGCLTSLLRQRCHLSSSPLLTFHPAAVIGTLALQHLNARYYLGQDLRALRTTLSVIAWCHYYDRIGATSADLWEAAARKTPDKSFLEFEGDVWSYRRMDQAANRYARWLRVCERGKQSSPPTLVFPLLTSNSMPSSPSLPSCSPILRSRWGWVPERSWDSCSRIGPSSSLPCSACSKSAPSPRSSTSTSEV